MSSLLSLKNSLKHSQKLHRQIGDADPTVWLSGALRLTEFVENKAPWKQLLLSEFEDELRLILQHDEIHIRLGVTSILIYSDEEATKRLLWNRFADSSHRIRKLMVRRFISTDRQRLYNTLFRAYLRDPSSLVRREAISRIRKEFSDLYMIEPDSLDTEEKIHCIEMLRPKSSYDHNLALRFMDDSLPGIVLSAALYLEKSGTLDNLIRKSSHKDETDLERRLKILSKAAEHQVTSFLEKKENFNGRASLYLAVEIFKRGIASAIFPWIIKKALTQEGDAPGIRSLKANALNCLVSRKDPESILLQKEFLEKKDFPLLQQLMTTLSPEGSILFYPVLKAYLLDKDFPFTDELVEAFSDLPLHIFLSDFYGIIRDFDLDPSIRKMALIILSRAGDFGSSLFILENISLLNHREMKILASLTSGWNRVHYIHSLKSLFSESDSEVHRGLMKMLSLSGNKDFLNEMVKRLSDSDSETRIAACAALKDLDETAAYDDMKELLHDPEKRVRSECARLLLEWDAVESLNEIVLILSDAEESLSVKDTIIRVFSETDNIKVIPVMLKLAFSTADLKDLLFEALLNKRSKHNVHLILEHYTDASEAQRPFYEKLFSQMGEAAEIALLDLIPAFSENHLQDSVSRILEATGFIDRLAGDLKSPSKSKRLHAATLLSQLSSHSANKALLLAAKDTNREIRIMALKALVKLQEEKEILTVLLNDPDKKVQRYAYWASERIKAGKLK